MELETRKPTKKSGEVILLHGEPGSGKTTCFKHLKGKTLILDADHGTDVLEGFENIDVIDIKNIVIENGVEIKVSPSKFIEKLADSLIEKCDYKNIVIDTLTTVENHSLAYYGNLGKNRGVPSQGDYQVIDFEMYRSYEKLISLKDRGINIIFTSWDSMVEVKKVSGEKYNRIIPNIRRYDRLAGLCSIVGHMEMQSKEIDVKVEGKLKKETIDKYYIRLSSTELLKLKDRKNNRKWCEIQDLIPTPKPTEKETK